MCSGGLLNLSWVLISSRSKNCLLECLSWEDPPDSRDQGFRIRIRWWRVTRSLKDAKRSSRTSKHPHKHSGDSAFGVDPVQYILHFLNFKGIDLLNNNDLTHLRLQKRRHSDRSREPPPPVLPPIACAHIWLQIHLPVWKLNSLWADTLFGGQAFAIQLLVNPSLILHFSWICSRFGWNNRISAAGKVGAVQWPYIITLGFLAGNDGWQINMMPKMVMTVTVTITMTMTVVEHWGLWPRVAADGETEPATDGAQLSGQPHHRKAQKLFN